MNIELNRVEIGRLATTELWIELARRLGVRFGKIQIAIHDGRPSKYAQVDMKISSECESVSDRMGRI